MTTPSPAPVWIDATMLWRWRHLAPVGIVRLERLVAGRLRSGGVLPPAEYVMWDRGYRPADAEEIVELDALLASGDDTDEDDDTDDADGDDGGQLPADAPAPRQGAKARVRRAGLRALGTFPPPLKPYAEQAAWSMATLAVETSRHVRRRVRTRSSRQVNTPAQDGVRHRIDLSDGGDLVALGLGWEYIDHEAMYRLRRDHGVRIHMPAFDLIPVQMPHLNAGQSHLVHRYYAEMAHYADSITSISYATRDALRSFYEREQLPTPELAVNQLPAFEAGDSKRAHRLRDRRFVLSVSTIEIRKNHLLLAKLWAECIREGRSMPMLVIVGRVGWDVEELRRWADHAPELIESMTMLQDVDDDELVALYRDAEFTLFPSRVEGWGLPISESLAHGKVCVHSDDPAQHEASQGLMPALHPDDLPAWRNEVERLLDDPAHRQQLERRIQEEYVPKGTEQYVEDFESVIAGRRKESER